MAKLVKPARTPPRPPKPAARKGASRPPVGLYLLLAAGTLVFLVGLGGLLLSLHGRDQTLSGPTINDSPPAPNFALADQQGRRIELAGLRGQVVALTFLYTHCPDVCPLIASKLSQADTQLGGDRAKVTLLAVTVDPANDTTANVQAFDAQHHLDQPNWHYLLGDVAQLTPVWKSYYVGTDAAEVPGAAAAKASNPPPALVGHTAIIYLIDRQGRLREALDANFAVPDFLHDVRILAGQ